MGRKTQTETLAKLLVAFLEERTWKQKDLERRCGVSTRAIRTRVLDLREAGVPIEREEDHPHVYYSVAEGWFPGGGTGFENLDHVSVARLIARLPRSDARQRILTRLVATAFGAPSVPSASVAEVTDETLSAFEDSAKRRVPLRLAYYSASRGEPGIRTISVLRIEYGQPLRAVAYCHRSSRLKWFRLDRATSPSLDATTTFLEASERDVDAFVRGSLDGYAGSERPVACSFLVRDKESHWVLRNLPRGAAAVVEHEDGGARATLHTSAVEVLARFLVAQGGAISEIEPDVLRDRVQRIARASLRSTGAILNDDAVRPIRSTRKRGAPASG